MHMPMQAGFALAVPVAAAVAVIALANVVAGAWFAVVPPAACAVWFGVVSLSYPDHVGSLGTLAGTAAAGWGVLLLVGGWGTRLLTPSDARVVDAPTRPSGLP